MHKSWMIFVVALLFMGNLKAIELSEEARVEVITCGPWQGELYSAFGHSAIRVVDPLNNFDLIYNYGVFDFNQPNFYLNFARGFLNYKLAVQESGSFIRYYRYLGRDIHAQELNLSREQRQKLFDFLQWNEKPENRYYRYDYFYDNCATRIRDALTTALGSDIVWDMDYVKAEETIRGLTDQYLNQQPWGDLGIDICLGLPMDKEASPFMYMFLPDYVYAAVAKAKVKKGEDYYPLVKRDTPLNRNNDKGVTMPFYTPTKLFWTFFLLMATLTIIEYRKGKWYRGIDIFWFSLMALFSIFLLLLWFATDHSAAARNFNLMWAWPGFIPAFIFLIRGKSKVPISYFQTQLIILLVFAVAWFFVPQQMHPALYPFLLISILRTLFITYRRKIHAA